MLKDLYLSRSSDNLVFGLWWDETCSYFFAGWCLFYCLRERHVSCEREDAEEQWKFQVCHHVACGACLFMLNGLVDPPLGNACALSEDALSAKHTQAKLKWKE